MGSRVFPYLIIVFLLLLGVMGYQLHVAKSESTEAKQSVSTLQRDLKLITDKLIDSENELERQRKEALLTAKTLSDIQKQKGELAVELSDSQQQLAEVIKHATDQHTKDWAVDIVPDGVNQLLQHQAYCANRGHYQDSVCLSTGRTDQ